MIRTLFLTLLTVLAANAASADEGGMLLLEIEGETYSFPLWESQSDWSGSAESGSVNIYARPLADDVWEKFKTFTLGFEFSGNSADVPEASLTRIVEGEQEVVFARGEAEKGGLKVLIDSVSADGEELSISGTLSAQMGYSENFGGDIDMSTPLDVAGTFVVTLGPVE